MLVRLVICNNNLVAEEGLLVIARRLNNFKAENNGFTCAECQSIAFVGNFGAVISHNFFNKGFAFAVSVSVIRDVPYGSLNGRACLKTVNNVAAVAV